MPSRNSVANAAELASFSPNDTGAASSAVRSTIVNASPRLKGKIARHVPGSPARLPQSLQNGNRAGGLKRDKKRAAVAGGSKVITGRRQTEWTGATQCP